MHNNPAKKPDPAASDETSANAQQGARKRRDPSEPAAVVGLGASAGGIAALQEFFSGMSPESGLAFVVVMHLSPEHESNLAAVLQQKTPMPVTQVDDAEKVRPNHVYVIPPGHQLAVEDDTLRLLPAQQAIGRRLTIDLFFRTLASAFGQRAVCAVLSGADSDGAIGVKHIRAHGGLVIAQEPAEAQYDSMPLMAIGTGMVDWVLPVAQMAPKLLEFVRNEHAMRLPPEIEEADEADVKVKHAPGGETVSDETRSPEDEAALASVLGYLRAQTGHDFSPYKRATVLRRIARRLQVNSLTSIPEYHEFLRTRSAEVPALLADMLIGVTHFFRDREAFTALEGHIPQLFLGKGKTDQVRVWVPGCSTGEEAYSIAMLLSEYAAKLPAAPTIQVFASDIDEHAIQDARDGIFPTTIEADISPERLRQFFAMEQGRYRVRKLLREKVLFSAHNLLHNAPFSRVDLISCRNLLIYFNSKAQEQAFNTFHYALQSGGLLFVGSAESSAVEGLFAPVDAKHRIYVRRTVPRAPWNAPALPLRAVDPAPHLRPVGRRRGLPTLPKATIENAGTGGADAMLQGQERRAVLFGELHLKLLEQYAPPSIVVNEDHHIVHLSDKAGRYLRFAAGEPSMNIFRVITPALQIELRSALFRASQGKEENVTSAPQTVPAEGGAELITLNVRRIASTPAEIYYLILFESKADVAPAASQSATEGEVTRRLDEEITYLKEQLSTTVEQYESSNEELKASNEELQAANEELRSATEELETNKEELQSVNEELTTVNAELKFSVEDLSRANSDLNNLMGSTDIGTVFLDRELRIVRFTPSAQMVFNLLPTDLGRPIGDITHRLQHEGLISDAEQVLASLKTIEREVQLDAREVQLDAREVQLDAREVQLDEKGRQWFLVRIAPYRTPEDRIAGVVATFIDITQRKKAQEQLRESEARFRAMFMQASVGIVQIGDGGQFLTANPGFCQIVGYTEQELSTMRVADVTHPEDYPREEELTRQLVSGEVPDFILEKRYRKKDGSIVWGTMTTTFVRQASGAPLYTLAIVQAIGDRKEAEERLRASEERFRTVADNVPQLIWTNDAKGDANYFNRRWYEYSGLSHEQSYGLGWQAMVHPDDAPASVARWEKAFAAGEVFDAEYRLRRADGAYRWFLGRNVPLRTDGTILSWFGTATDIDDYKQAQTKLRETEEKFRLLVEGTPDYAMFLLDQDNNITYWSAGAQRVFQWTSEEAIGQKGSMIFTPEDLEKGEDQKEIAQSMEQGSAPDRRWHIRKDGTRMWLDGFMRRLDDPQTGALRGFAKIAREATEQKMAEEKLREAYEEMEQRVHHRTKELQAMNESLEQEMTGRQQLEKELLEISEREKRRIGEDLHDMICQELTATALFLKSSAKQLGDGNPVAVAKLDEAAHIVNQNVGTTRDLARGLQPAELAGGGLRQALRALADQACENTGMKCHVKFARGVRVADETIGLHVYRIAQEAVKNAIKHSGAKNLLITLDKNKDHVCISVEDDGKGFTPNKRSKGLGLHIMRYRANALGGELKIERRTRGGTEIRCKIPLKR